MIRIRPALAFIFLLSAVHAPLADVLSGRPPMTRLAPDIEVYPQNFDVTQDRHGVVYVANSDGVLTWDGAIWRLIPLPNHDIVRTLTYDPESERIYVGGFGVFGFIERSEDGQAHYHDVTGLFAEQIGDRPLADIWRILVTAEGVYFQAVKDLFLYRPEGGAVAHWHHDGRFGAMLLKGEELWMQWRGQGIKRLAADGWELVPGTESLIDNLYYLLERPDGSVLGLGVDGQWPLWRDGRLERFDAGALGSSAQYSGVVSMEDGSLVLATSDGFLVMTSPDGVITRRVRIGHGWVAGLYRSADGTLLATTDGGEVVALRWPPEWQLIDSSRGLTGVIYAVKPHAGQLYALGTSGLFLIEPDAAGLSAARALDWAEFETWDLLSLGDQALITGSYRVYQVGPDLQSRPISEGNLYPRTLVHSRFDPDRVWVTTEKGLAIAGRRGPDWAITADLESLDTLVVTLLEIDARELWLGTYGNGVIRARIGPDFQTIEQWEDWGESRGLEFDKRKAASVHALSSGRYATTDAGVFRWDGNGNRWLRDTFFGLDRLLEDHEAVNVAEAPDGTLWAHSYNRIYRKPPGAEWTRLGATPLTRGPYSDLTFVDGNAVFGSNATVIEYLGDQGSQGIRPEVMLREVRYTAPDAKPRHLPLTPQSELRFPAGESAFTFRYSLPDLAGPSAVRYQARLVGFESDYSDWVTGTQLTYTALEPGPYRFEVRARDSDGRISEAAAFSFAITPPWYATTAARLAGLLALVVLGAAASYGAMRWRTAKLSAHNATLERLVADRTRALLDANRQLKDLADRDGLTGIANRRRFDWVLEQVWAQGPLSLMMADVDRFKDYNDRNGHLAGDDLLRSIARRLRDIGGEHGGTVARYGGEEFALIFPGMDRKEARRVAENVRKDIFSTTEMTISIGLATTRKDDTDPADLVHRADQALYRAKQGGRNRVESLSES